MGREVDGVVVKGGDKWETTEGTNWKPKRGDKWETTERTAGKPKRGQAGKHTGHKLE